MALEAINVGSNPTSLTNLKGLHHEKIVIDFGGTCCYNTSIIESGSWS
jgi:hypothetical protein